MNIYEAIFHEDKFYQRHQAKYVLHFALVRIKSI